MRVVVDTNVLVSAVLRGRTPKEVIQFIIDTPDCDWLVSKEILEEYKQVLSRPKFKLTPEIITVITNSKRLDLRYKFFSK